VRRLATRLRHGDRIALFPPRLHASVERRRAQEAELAAAGLCRPPAILPPWAGDLRRLVAYLTYSAFLNRVNLAAIRAHYEELFATPITTDR
jgi:hypothetical protein